MWIQKKSQDSLQPAEGLPRLVLLRRVDAVIRQKNFGAIASLNAQLAV